MSAFLAALESCVIDGAEQELTEPMPRPDSGGDPTLRVTTPSRRTGPPTGSEEVSEATYYPDFLKTPASSEATSASADQAGDAGERRRGVGRILLPGGVVAALAAVVGLYFFGPLKPILQQGRLTDSNVPAAVEPSATDREPIDAGDASPSDVQPVDEGVDAEPVVARDRDRGGTTDPPPIAEDRNNSRETDADARGERLAAAQSANGEVLAARQAAVTAGADVIFGTELAALDVQLQETDGMLQSEQFDEATTSYSDLVRDYGQLAARSSEAAEQGAIQAVRARREMQQGREAAIEGGARQRARAALTRAGMIANQARVQFDAGNYSEAENLFRQAEQAYAELVVGGPGGEDQPAEPERPALTAEQTIAGMIDRFGELFAREDLPGMGVELYRRSIPGDDRGFLTAVFDRADDIEVIRLERSLTVEGTSATADVRLRMRFNQSRTGASGERDVAFRMEFVSGLGGWRLVAANPQR